MIESVHERSFSGMACKTPRKLGNKLSSGSQAIVSDGGKTHQFQVEMAMTPQQQEVGLMFRHEVAPDSGMLTSG